MNDPRGATTSREVRSRETRRRIIESAEAVFAQQGFHSAALIEIARRAGVGTATLYSHFEGKLDLLREVTRRKTTELEARVAGRTDPEGAPHRLPGDALGAFFEWVALNRGIYQVARQSRFVDAETYAHLHESIGNALGRALERAGADVALIEDRELLSCVAAGLGDVLVMSSTPGRPSAADRVRILVDVALRALGLDESVSSSVPTE